MNISPALLLDLLASAMRLCTPIAFTAFGSLFSERSGVVNIGLEGYMTVGAFMGFLGSLYFGNPVAGVLVAMICTAAIALVFALMTVTLRADQVIAGLALNLFVAGAAAFFFRRLATTSALGTGLNAPSFRALPVPYLSKIPFLGPVFFNHVPLVYVMYVTLPLVYVLLFKTNWGLQVRSVGEHPLAAETSGINVHRIRYQAQAVCGALSGVGGAMLSIGSLSAFNEGLVSGRGFIALAAVIFGQYMPLGAVGASFLFGLTDALQIRLQVLLNPGFSPGFPVELFLMLPYLLALIAFVGLVRRSITPAASGKPYP